MFLFNKKDKDVIKPEDKKTTIANIISKLGTGFMIVIVLFLFLVGFMFTTLVMSYVFG